MKFFINSVSVNDLEAISRFGVLDGVNVDLSLFDTSRQGAELLLSTICKLTNGPVCITIRSEGYSDILHESLHFSKIAPNICINLPITPNGIMACRALASDGIMVNMTLCFSLCQALMAGKAGARFISFFIGCCDEVASDGLSALMDIRSMLDSCSDIKMQIIVHSVRHAMHVAEAVKVGAAVVIIQPKIVLQLMKHRLTDATMQVSDIS